MLYRDEIDDQILGKYANRMNYRARQYQAVGQITPADLRSLIMTSKGQCEWCRRSLLNADFEIDHIISLSKGGPNEAGNLAVSCIACNRRKYEKQPLQFAQEFVAANGYKTPLVARILNLYGESAYRQQTLFDNESNENAKSAASDRPESNEENNPPPYRW